MEKQVFSGEISNLIDLTLKSECKPNQRCVYLNHSSMERIIRQTLDDNKCISNWNFWNKKQVQGKFLKYIYVIYFLQIHTIALNIKKILSKYSIAKVTLVKSFEIQHISSH
jgi:hypothetical protein